MLNLTLAIQRLVSVSRTFMLGNPKPSFGMTITMEDCIFCKIAKGEIKTEFLYEDDDVMAFKDIHPVKPIHILIVPKEHIEDILALEDPLLKEKLLSVVQNMAESAELDDKGFRISINGGGAQEIHHLHIHVMGPMGSKVKMTN